MFSTTCVVGYCWAFFTVVNLPVLALRPIFIIFSPFIHTAHKAVDEKKTGLELTNRNLFMILVEVRAALRPV